MNNTEQKQGRPRKTIELDSETRNKLELIARRPKTSQRDAMRARILLLNADGMRMKDIAKELEINKDTVSKWVNRYLEKGLEGLTEEPRPGAPRKIDDSKIEEIITKTLEGKPENATHWSTRLMAQEVGLCAATISSIWRTIGLQPHREDYFKLSNDPLFIEKVRDVIGLYMSPPQNALVLCVDEKSQIQALERTQPILPMRPGAAESKTHDYYRHGTTTLFAAYNIQTGEVLGKCMDKHTRVEFLKFLRYIDRNTPKELEIHLVMDNYATHKTIEVQNWLKRHPRFHSHFVPTYSSWLNQVERWFGLITQKSIRRNAFTSVKNLIETIEGFIQKHNENPKPFKWKADADSIFEKIASFCRRFS